MTPVISIRVITYNHARYIAQCLESLLMQRTEYPFEIIIGEDCSTDDTQAIVTRYHDHYPDTIKLITSDANVGAFHNAVRVGQACRGKYHAFCEGDDYWIDPLKIQKQVAMLEAHPGYSACCHDVIGVSETSERRCIYYTPAHDGEVVSRAAVMQATVTMPLAGMVVRASVIDSLPAWRGEVWAPDLVLRMWCAYQGDIGYIPGAMAIYRIHGTGVTATTAPGQKLRNALYCFNRFNEETGGLYSSDLHQAMRNARRAYGVGIVRRVLGRWSNILAPRQLARRLRRWLP